jgi:hypothetical protein
MKDDEQGADAKATTEFVSEVVEERVKSELQAPVEGEEGETRVKAMVDLETMDRLQAMADKADRAQVYHIAAVSVDGTYMYAPDEPSTIGEWLAGALDETKSASEYSDLKFIAEQLVPFMVKNNIGNAAVLWASGYKKKARTAVPYLRYLFKEAPFDLVDQVKKVIGWITDPKVTKKDIEDALKDARGVDPPVPATTYETILPGKKTRLVIVCNDEQLTVIKKRLKNLIDIVGAEPEPVKKGVGI